MRSPRNQKPVTRQRIVDKATNRLRNHGAHAVGVASSMKDAGLTHGGFYAHFASRDALLAAAVLQLTTEGEAVRRLEAAAEPAAALSAFLDAYLSPVHCERLKGLPEMESLPQEARASVIGFAGRLTERLAGVLGELGRPTPTASALSMLGKVIGAATLARALSSPGVRRSLLDAARRELAIEHGLTGPAGGVGDPWNS